MAVRRRKAQKVPTLIRWSSTLLVMGVYFALGAIYVIPGLAIFRLAANTGVAEATVTVGFGLRSLARMVVGNLTRTVFRTQMLGMGYACVAVILSISTASIPWINYIYVLQAMFACHGMCFAYVKNTSRMILRNLWAQRLPKFIKVRNYHFLAGAIVGPFLAYPPTPQEPMIQETAYLLCTFRKTITGNDTSLDVECHKDKSCFEGWTPNLDTNLTTTAYPVTAASLPVTTPSSTVTDTFTSCSKIVSPESSFVESLTSFETQYLLAGWIALMTGFVAGVALHYYEKAVLLRALRKKGKGPLVEKEELTGTKLDILPAIARKPVQNVLESIGLMKYVPKSTKTEDQGGAPKSRLDFIPEPIRGPIKTVLEATGLMKLGTNVTGKAEEVAEQLKDKVSLASGQVEGQLADKEKEILAGEERKKSGNIQDLKAGAMGKVASGIADIAGGAVKKEGDAGPSDYIEEVPEGDSEDVAQLDDTKQQITKDAEAGKGDESSSDEEDELEEAMEDAFQIILAIFMSIVMGLSAVMTYTNFIAKYLMTLGSEGLELSAITTMFNICVTIGCTIVINMYRKFKIYHVLFVCSIFATTAMAFQCAFGQHYYVCWALTAVFGIFAGKIQEGVEDIADEYDILSDEFEGIMDKGESIVLAIIPTAMGYLMAWEPKSLFYVTVAAFGICTAFLTYIPTTVKRMDLANKRKLGIDDFKPDVEMNDTKPQSWTHSDTELYDHAKETDLFKSKSTGTLSTTSARSKFLKWLDYY